jgi:hypothetical protein
MFTDEHRCASISITYSIWSSRNRITHDKEDSDPIQTLKKIMEELHMLEFQGKIPRSPPGKLWRPPDPGWIKINTDGATH